MSRLIEKLQKFHKDFLTNERDISMLKKTLRQFYESCPSYYDMAGSKEKNAERRVALALDSIQKAGNHLELGCAKGHFVIEAAKQGIPSLGLDISHLALKRAVENKQSLHPKGRVDFCQADMEYLPLRNGSFDVVTSFESLEHVVSPFEVLAEMVRVLKPGGLLIMDCAHGYDWVRIRGVGQVIQNAIVLCRFLLSILKVKRVQRNIPRIHPSVWNPKDGFHPDDDRVSRYTSKAVYDTLREQGMTIKILDTFCWRKDEALLKKDWKRFLYYHRLSKNPFTKYFGTAILIVAVKGKGEPNTLSPWRDYFKVPFKDA